MPAMPAMVAMLALTHRPSPRMNACIRTHAALQEIDLVRAARQHDDYCRALTDAGATVTVLEVNAEHPDACFIEDTAIVLDEIAIITSMGAAARQPEPQGIEPEIAQHRSRIARIADPSSPATTAIATIEGGDVILVGKTLLVGLTARTNAEGIAALAAIVSPFGYEVRAVPITGDCLHLKTACTALPDGALLVNRAWLDPALVEDFTHVHVAKEEPHGANVVVVGEDVVMAAAYPKTAEIVARHARNVHRVELTEFAKADGCATCLSLVFRPSGSD